MPADATQGMGADVADLESMFADEGDDGAVSTAADSQLDAVAQIQSGADTQAQNNEEVLELDEHGNPVEKPVVEVDADGNEVVVEVDPNAVVDLVIPDDHKIKLKIDGEEVEYTFGDLKAGVQKAQAADKRFEEAAAIRKEYVEKSANLTTREGQLEQVLTHYIGQSQALMQAQEPNWAELIASDPQKYLTERHNWEIKQAQLNEARQIQANVARQQAEQQAASQAQRVGEERVKLQAAIPEWADPKKAAEGARALDQYLADQGVPQELRGSIDSAEVLVIARKAMLYDQAVAAAKARKGAKAPVVPAATQQGKPIVSRPVQGRVERPGAATAAQTAASRQNLSRANAEKTFKANPSVDTLAGFFE